MQSDINKVEISIEEAQSHIDLSKALERLHDNADFQKVILNNYFMYEASRAVLLKADPEMFRPGKQDEVDRVIAGIGQLRQYFLKIFNLGDMAERSIEADKQTQEELLKEEILNNGGLQ